MLNNTAIAITLYKRPRQTEAFLKYLEKCVGVENYPIYILIDGDTGVPAIHRVHELVQEFCTRNPHLKVWCAHDIGSYGIDRAKIKLLDTVFAQHNAVIFMEDDTYPTKNTLIFIEKQLKLYGSDPNLVSITGYRKQPIGDTLPVKGSPKLELSASERQMWFTPWVWYMSRDKYYEIYGLSGQKYIAMHPNEVNGKFDWYCRQYIGEHPGTYSIRPMLSYVALIDAAEGATHTPSQAWFEEHEKTWIHHGMLDYTGELS